MDKNFQDIYLAVSTIIEICVQRGILKRKNQYSIEELIAASKELEKRDKEEHEQILRSNENN